MKYKKPPVMEVGMTFSFDPSESTPEWSEDVAIEYLSQFEGDFPNREIIFRQEFRIETDVKKKIQRTDTSSSKVNEVVARRADGYEVLGLGQNCMTYHKIRKDEDFPHYKPVAERAFQVLPKYIGFWRPKNIKFISLLYLDHIAIPCLGIIDLDDYFKIGVKFPDEEFGPVMNFDCRLNFPGKQDKMRLDVLFRQTPFITQNHEYYIHWDCKSMDINSLNVAQIRYKMDSLHEYVLTCFEASFTEECKKLFEPIEG